MKLSVSACLLMDFLGRQKNLTGIVYALSRKRIEEVAEKLQQAGLSSSNID
jgi:ATP-dependent DNA helicase RecQ